MMLKSCAIAALLLIAFSGPARAGTATISWDPSPEANVAGYIVSYGTQSQSYSTSIDVGGSTTFQVSTLDWQQTYYFAVRAYDSAGGVSAFSMEVATTPHAAASPDPSPAPAPAPDGLTVTSLVANLSAPQDFGVSVGFTAAVSGGLKPYEYKWLVFDGTSWSVAEEWSLNSSFVWRPDVANENYRVGVMVRDDASDPDSTEISPAGSMSFPITDPAPEEGNRHPKFPDHPRHFKEN